MTSTVKLNEAIAALRADVEVFSNPTLTDADRLVREMLGIGDDDQPLTRKIMKRRHSR